MLGFEFVCTYFNRLINNYRCINNQCPCVEFHSINNWFEWSRSFRHLTFVIVANTTVDYGIVNGAEQIDKFITFQATMEGETSFKCFVSFPICIWLMEHMPHNLDKYLNINIIILEEHDSFLCIFLLFLQKEVFQMVEWYVQMYHFTSDVSDKGNGTKASDASDTGFITTVLLVLAISFEGVKLTNRSYRNRPCEYVLEDTKASQHGFWITIYLTFVLWNSCKQKQFAENNGCYYCCYYAEYLFNYSRRHSLWVWDVRCISIDLQMSLIVAECTCLCARTHLWIRAQLYLEWQWH